MPSWAIRAAAMLALSQNLTQGQCVAMLSYLEPILKVGGYAGLCWVMLISCDSRQNRLTKCFLGLQVLDKGLGAILGHVGQFIGLFWCYLRLKHAHLLAMLGYFEGILGQLSASLCRLC